MKTIFQLPACFSRKADSSQFCLVVPVSAGRHRCYIVCAHDLPSTIDGPCADNSAGGRCDDGGDPQVDLWVVGPWPRAFSRETNLPEGAVLTGPKRQRYQKALGRPRPFGPLFLPNLQVS